MLHIDTYIHAIEEYQFEHGFSTAEIAASHRRRIFDVGYLFIEMVTDKYIYEKAVKSFEALDEVQHIGLREKAFAAYLALSEQEKKALETMETQAEIEEELKKILKNVQF